MSQNFPGTFGRKMKLSEAKKMVDDYQLHCDDKHLRSLTIDVKHLKAIMAQPDCQYIRFFVALHDPAAKAQGVPIGHSLVVAGVNSKNAVIKQGEDDTEIYEDMSICPPECDDNGTL